MRTAAPKRPARAAHRFGTLTVSPAALLQAPIAPPFVPEPQMPIWCVLVKNFASKTVLTVRKVDTGGELEDMCYERRRAKACVD